MFVFFSGFCPVMMAHIFYYICIHVYMYTCIHVYIHTYIHPSMHTYIHTSIHPYIHTSIHPYIHTSIHPYIHTSIHPYIHPYIHPSIHPSIHTYICRYYQILTHIQMLYTCFPHLPTCLLLFRSLGCALLLLLHGSGSKCGHLYFQRKLRCRRNLFWAKTQWSVLQCAVVKSWIAIWPKTSTRYSWLGD